MKKKQYVLTKTNCDGVIVEQVVSRDKGALYEYMNKDFFNEKDEVVNEWDVEHSDIDDDIDGETACLNYNGYLYYSWIILECETI